ncbi:MAG: lysophospholipid acyltransferase family protein [Candidatus Humimicrobiaceae bacterium]
MVYTKHNKIYRVFYLSLVFILRSIFKLLFRVETYNFENIPSQGKLILCSNHVSYIDPVMIGAFINRYIYFMAKIELFKNRFLSAVVTFLNAFPVNRTATDRSSIRTAVEVLKEGQMLALFPEGTRSVNGIIREGKKGVGLISVMSKAPIIPVAIKNTNKIVQKPKKRLFFPKVKMIAGSLIEVDEIIGKYPKKEATAIIVSMVMDEIKKLHNKIS